MTTDDEQLLREMWCAYTLKVDVLVERNRGSIPERAAADAAMRGEG